VLEEIAIARDSTCRPCAILKNPFVASGRHETPDTIGHDLEDGAWPKHKWLPKEKILGKME
jgi:hypothetical protein